MSDARVRCVALYEQMREQLSSWPEEAAYRTAVDKAAAQRLAILQDSSLSAEQAEEALGTQFEELHVEAKEQLELLPIMLRARPWEVDPSKQIEVRVTDF